MDRSAGRDPARPRRISPRSHITRIDKDFDRAADDIAAFVTDIGRSSAAAMALLAETERCDKKPGATVPIESERWLQPFCFDAFSLRKPGSISLRNALRGVNFKTCHLTQDGFQPKLST